MRRSRRASTSPATTPSTSRAPGSPWPTPTASATSWRTRTGSTASATGLAPAVQPQRQPVRQAQLAAHPPGPGGGELQLTSNADRDILVRLADQHHHPGTPPRWIRAVEQRLQLQQQHQYAPAQVDRRVRPRDLQRVPRRLFLRPRQARARERRAARFWSGRARSARQAHFWRRAPSGSPSSIRSTRTSSPLQDNSRSARARIESRSVPPTSSTASTMRSSRQRSASGPSTASTASKPVRPRHSSGCWPPRRARMVLSPTSRCNSLVSTRRTNGRRRGG